MTEAAMLEALPALDETLQDALDAVGKIIRFFEQGDEKAGYTLLAQLLQAIKAVYGVMSQDAAWAAPSDAEILRSEIPAKLEDALKQLIAVNERRDWIGVSDILEYEITPIVASCKRIVEETRAQSARGR